MPTPKKGYRLADGTRVPGTTTIIGRFKDSGGLLYWAFAQGKLAEQGVISKLYDKAEEAAEFGTIAHGYIDDHIHGRKVVLDRENAQPAVTAYETYLKWEKSYKVDFVDTEMQLVSEEYRFGGTPDAVGIINGELCLIDWKTSNSVYVDHLIQLSCYGYLWNNANPGNPITGGYHLCRFAKENGDFSHHFWPNLDEAWEAFKHMRVLYDLVAVLKKRAG
jgi:hypothetical protein